MMLDRCQLKGAAKALRIGMRGVSSTSGWKLHQMAEEVLPVPSSLVCMKGVGVQLSQLVNPCLSPVAVSDGKLATMSRLSQITGTGQGPSNLLTAKELIEYRQKLRLMQP